MSPASNPRPNPMALLLYCVAGPSAALSSRTGVAGAAVLRFEHSGLVAFYSANATPDVWLRTPLRTSASEFHQVQRELFHTQAIIPFRFPTILESRDELRKHLDERSTEYNTLLRRFADCVQMDISLTYAPAAERQTSGADYLRQRQNRNQALEQFASQLRIAAGPLAQGWQERSLANGVRCFALVAREQVQDFNEIMEKVVVPPDLSARVSGPWPVAEFLDFAT
jgi:gas vesicle protein GvpL/GvpF